MTRFRLILSAICIILLGNFSLIVYFELEQKRELDRINQLGVDNQLWQFFQLNIEYLRLSDAVVHGDRFQLDDINNRFDIYFGRIDGFSKGEDEASAIFSNKKLKQGLLQPLLAYIYNFEKILKKTNLSDQEWQEFKKSTLLQQDPVNDLIQEARTKDQQAMDEYRGNITRWGEWRIILATTQILLLVIFALLGLYALWRSEQGRKRLAELAETLLEARQQAESANQTKSRFLAHISHEIRTPLTSILGYADRLLRNNNLAKAEKNEVACIANSGTHLLSLLNNVLDLSKSENNKISLLNEVLNLNQLKNELETMFAMMAKDKNIAFSINFAENVCLDLSLDAGKLRQILINLLGNSLKFTKNGTINLTFCGEKLAQCYLLHAVVSDTGSGINKEDQARIFSPFEQSKEGQLAGGTGLGLSLSRDYARLMNGDITFVSEKGKGSQFTVSIETQEVAPSIPLPISHPQQQSLLGLVILVVEDEAINREMMCGILQDFGAQTLQAANGLEAISQVNTHPEIDSIIMDYQMPKMDGMVAAGLLREQHWDKSIYLVSASPLDELKLAAGFAAFSGHLRKPFKIDELIELLCAHDVLDLMISTVLLDHQSAINLMGFKLERYLVLSKKGLSRIAELENLYKTAIEQQQVADAKCYAHSAKGIALQIGAEILAQHWGVVEVQLSADAINTLRQIRLDTEQELEKIFSPAH